MFRSLTELTLFASFSGKRRISLSKLGSAHAYRFIIKVSRGVGASQSQRFLLLFLEKEEYTMRRTKIE
jgi:hypothetical protein